MNHRGGLALIKATWASWLQHRSFFFILAFGWMIPPLIYLLVWSTAAGGQDHRRAEPGRVCRLLLGVDPGQPAYLFADQLDGGRPDSLWTDEPLAGASTFAVL